MTLNPEQKQAVSAWVAAGDNLSLVQKKLAEQFKISMTYRDVRFLVDDLNLELKDPAPKVDTSDLSKTTPVPPPTAGPADADDALPPEHSAAPGEEDFPAPGASTLTLDVDRIVRPGAVVSGTVTFSDGTSGKWALDQQGRLMLETPQKGYQPSPADVQAFQRALQAQLQRHGFWGEAGLSVPRISGRDSDSLAGLIVPPPRGEVTCALPPSPTPARSSAAPASPGRIADRG